MKKITTSLVAGLLIATNLYSQTSLEPITVTSATKTSQSIKDVTSNINVITSQEIEERHYTTVVEALNTLPGVSVASNGGLGQTTSVYLRGMDSNKTLVLIDGIRYNDPTGLSGASFEHLMIGDIERIEVIKGAQSSVWGADASAGVINIITKSAKDGTHGNIAVEYGSFETKKVNANISHKDKNFDAKLNVSRLDSDGFTAIAPRNADVGDFEDDRYKNTSANLKLGYNFDDNNRISGSYGIINAKTNYDNQLMDMFWNLDPVASANSEPTVKTKNRYGNVNYENINDFATTNVYANRSTFKREYSDSSMPEYEGNVKEYGVKSTVDYLDNSSFVTLGADYKEFEHKSSLNKEYKSKAIYLTNNNKFNDDNTIITESLRVDSYDSFDNKTTGKIGIKQYIIDELNVSSNYGTGYNVPTIYQLFEPVGSWGPVGNENLQPEKTKSFDVQVEYKGLSATYFDTKVDNMIAWGNGYANIEGKSKLKGYELAFKKDVIEDLFLNLAYTHLAAKDSKENRLLNRPNDKFNFGVDYYGISKLHLNVNGEYVGDRFSPDFIDYTKKAKTGNYTLWNSVINYEISKTFSTYLKVDNIFNKYYQVVDGYATAKRSAYVGLKASF